MRGGDGLDEARADLRGFGATEEQIEFQLGPRADAFEVWPEAWDAWRAFCHIQTQWSTGAAGATGLDYTRVRDGLAMAGVEVTPDMFHQLRVFEAGVLEILNKSKPKPSK